MCYIKAKEVLPGYIIELIQQYVDGENIYIPKKEGNRLNWGNRTNTKEELAIRNIQIYRDYISGVKRNILAEKYFLSRKSIDRIILKEKTILINNEP